MERGSAAEDRQALNESESELFQFLVQGLSNK